MLNEIRRSLQGEEAPTPRRLTPLPSAFGDACVPCAIGGAWRVDAVRRSKKADEARESLRAQRAPFAPKPLPSDFGAAFGADRRALAPCTAGWKRRG